MVMYSFKNYKRNNCLLFKYGHESSVIVYVCTYDRNGISSGNIFNINIKY